MLSRLTFEVFGVCNARCPYCVTGAKMNAELSEGQRFLTRETAASVLDYTINNQIIAPNALIDLFNWGEPFLNPQLDQVLEEINCRGMGYVLSTNGSIFRHIEPQSLASLQRLTVSFPGFSQASYDRIHGFDFNRIRRNVEELVDDIKSANSKARIVMAFHVYQFNLAEIEAAHEWCTKQGMFFLPYLAYWNGYELSRKYLTGEVKSNSELILGYEKSIIERCAKGKYRCPQWDMLTLDQMGRVALCCVMDTSNKECYFKDVRECSAKEIQIWKETRPICQECISLGIAQWGHNPLVLSWNPVTEDIQEKINTQAVLVIRRYESTFSWKITKPLRLAAKYLKLGR